MESQERIKGVLFCGGRGAGTIAKALAAHSQIELTILVNAYDDGLSTGSLRRFIPGMLGPSDIRKNYSRLLDESTSGGAALRYFLEYRFPLEVTSDVALGALEGLANGTSLPIEALEQRYSQLTVGQAKRLASYSRAFLKYAQSAKEAFEYPDCSLGNLFFAGAYLDSERRFNQAISEFAQLAPVPARILNVTQGEGCVLVALKEDGTFLRNEAEIVGKQNAVSIREIFLLRNYLNDVEEGELGQMAIEEKAAFLKSREALPLMDPQVGHVLREANLIVYGPGTQHSSLFPSYVTQGLAQAIADNQQAQKIFISNIRRDHEIPTDTATTLIKKLVFYMNQKGALQNGLEESALVSRCFVQCPDESGADYVTLDDDRPSYAQPIALDTNWEQGEGVHLGGKVVDELVSIVNETAKQHLKSSPYMVSIVVPALNEAKTVAKVLHDLVLLDFYQPLGLSKEILFVDGGSTDGTFESAKREGSVRCFQLKRGSGRGEALRLGMEKAQGNVVVFFPSDAEYNASDLLGIVASLVKDEFQVVFGSRAIKCVNMSDRIREIYLGNYLGYLASKYGGMLLSTISLFLYGRFISDPLTGIKAFDAKLLRSLKLRSAGLNLDTEIIAKLGRRGLFILELPVDYHPRKKRDGKKTTVLEGLRSLLSLIRYRWASLSDT